MITWSELTDAEPRLLDLEKEVRAEAARADSDPTWSFSIYWSYTLRPAIKPLVGWERDTGAHPRLESEEAWHAAISYLIGLLPEEQGLMAS
ncbi:hypothetical protein [Streptomyces coeruleorubidus]|uniref:Uncharacterized protein n=1 Tax=Streptomyces coeruleorubidus TaxID=116188 RepID=A0A5J6HXX7_STRC4|nr:hypothetical protein [Streptomyces coeruleorubidus]QEV23992.1 hypothetical protein CP976_07415 [Streptomyces coeruleorubidus]GGT85536.1 hypothetical protein GCM10010256_52050 [Streptomyces coeruleorubidus]